MTTYGYESQGFAAGTPVAATLSPAASTSTTTSAPTRAASSATQKDAAAFRTISEVADFLGVQQHVLRFWETRFSQVRPLKRGGGRRYYRPEDIELLSAIHNLLYTQGYTIKGVQKLLRERGKNRTIDSVFQKQGSNDDRPVAAVAPVAVAPVPAAVPVAAVSAPIAASGAARPVAQPGFGPSQREALEALAEELRGLRKLLTE